eukprot:gene40347-1359_t
MACAALALLLSLVAALAEAATASSLLPDPAPSFTGLYDASTAAAVSCFQREAGVRTVKLVNTLSADGWTDDGRSAAELGFKFKVLVPVHRNRSVETTATLLDAHNNVLHTFPARAHGHDVDSDGFSRYGGTPTGLTAIDLNSPEDIPRLYGPFPVLRFVSGVAGNSAFLVPAIRDGILIHTGYWANHSDWRPGEPMPNSAGCVHTYLNDVETVWRLLVDKAGVSVRPNTGGKLPYPFKSQGVASVFEVRD